MSQYCLKIEELNTFLQDIISLGNANGCLGTV